MLNRYLLSLFIASLSISCLSAYEQDFQEFKDFQAYKEYQKTKDKKIFAERERKNYQEQQRLERLEQEEKQCCQEEGRNSYEEYLEFLEYRRGLERENRYCKDLEKARLCEISQIDPNKDRLENFRFSADWLYFKAVQDALPYIVDLGSLDVTSSSFFAGSLDEPKWKYNSGIRLAFALPTGLDNWEVGASWSFVGNKTSRSKNTSSEPTHSLFAIQGSANLDISGDVIMNVASQKWKLTFNTADITLESPIYINNSLKIRPIIGIQGSSIRQKTNVGYSDYVKNLFAGATPPTKVQAKNDTWGVGPKFGLGLALAMPYEVNFNFLACFASLFGQGKSKTTYSDFVMIQADGSIEIPTGAPSNTISYKTTRMYSLIQIQGAIEKAWDFDCASVSLAIGWEAQTWFRQQRLIYYGNVSNPSQGSDLTLQGPFARINMDF